MFNINNLKLARYKEIFPGAAKTDAIDARKGLELFMLSEHLTLAKNSLQAIVPAPEVNDRLKRLSRRRRRLVTERVIVKNGMHSDLQAVCPELLAITQDIDQVWYLNLHQRERIAQASPKTGHQSQTNSRRGNGLFEQDQSLAEKSPFLG